MRKLVRCWWSVLAVLAVLAAGCAADETAPDPVAVTTTAETQPAAPTTETEPGAAPEPEPETEAEPAPTTSTTADAAVEPAPTTSAVLEPEEDVAPEAEADTTAVAEAEPEPEAESDSTTAPEPEPEPEPATAEPSSGVAAVLALLDALTVTAEHTSGYDRHLFNHWTDEDKDGCDTRREVLLAEAVVAPARGSRCSLSDGEWISRYDGQTEQGNGRGFDVDHLVPLKEAWESGAHGWSSDRREQYANDLGYEHSLIAVSARSNRSKSAQDPATWMPPDAGQHCWYAAAWVHVKTRWSLTVDTAEVNAVRGVLSGCSDADLNIGLPAPVVEEPPATTTTTTTAPPTTTTTTAPPTTTTTTAPPTTTTTTTTAPPTTTTTTTTTAPPTTTQAKNCHPAYTPCLPNLPGDALNCGDLTSDQKPVTINQIGVDPYRLDRDGDGRGCTS